MTTAQRIGNAGILLAITLIFSPLLAAGQPSYAGSLKIEVTSSAVGNSFQAYVGGGTNISPPAPLPFHGGDKSH